MQTTEVLPGVTAPSGSVEGQTGYWPKLCCSGRIDRASLSSVGSRIASNKVLAIASGQ